MVVWIQWGRPRGTAGQTQGKNQGNKATERQGDQIECKHKGGLPIPESEVGIPGKAGIAVVEVDDPAMFHQHQKVEPKTL